MIRTWLAAATAALLVTGAASADSISPTSFETTIGIGETASLTKTVTVDAGRPDTAKVDIFFLADETGSMGGEIADVKAAAAAILGDTAGLGDVAWGVGGYRDYGDSWVYREISDLTTSSTDTQTAINTWVHGGGGDGPEANLTALTGVANDTTWRTGSKRIVVWFGDYYGHDPSGTATEASTIAALQAKGITVHALSAGSNFLLYGQTENIVNATGGTLANLGTGEDEVTASILAAIDTSFAEYSTVQLEVAGDSSCVDVGWTPSGGYTGDFSRAATETYEFDVTFTGAAAGTCEFEINALVDGGIVAVEKDKITVTSGTPVIPVPASLPLLLGAFGVAGLITRRKRAA